MKKPTLLLGTFCAMALAANALQEVKIVRTYKVGEADKYLMTMDMTSAMGAITIKVASTQKVAKVYDNGDADVETTVNSLTVNAMGNEMNPPIPAVTTQKFNKYGMQVGKSVSSDRGGMDFLRYLNVIGDRALKVGETIPIDYKNPDDAKDTAKGNVKIESLTDSVLKMVAYLDITNKQTEGGKPMNVALTSWIDVRDGKPEKVEGVVTNLPANAQGGMQIDKVNFSVVRQK